MNSQEINNLMLFGFDKGEAIIYTLLVGRKYLSITEISILAQIKRPTCYEYIESMLHKNCIFRVPVGKKFHYAATDPQKILKMTQRNMSIFENNISILTEKYNDSIHRPKVMFYEGKHSLRDIYKDSFSAVGDALSIFPADSYFEKYSFEEFAENEKLIKDTKFKSKDLIVEGKQSKKVYQFLNELNNENKITKKLSKDFKTSVDVLVYGSKVALISLKNLSALVIDNQEISELFTTIHSNLWKNAK